MQKENRIILLGSNGFIGSAVSQKFKNTKNFLGLSREFLDVLNYSKLKKTLKDFNPDIVINATGRVAGIQGNIEHPTELMIANSETIISVSKVCHELNINKLFQFASACVYPLNEISSSSPNDIGTGLIEETSKGYATAKIFGIELFDAFRKEFGYDWCTIIPSNLYGTGDWKSSRNGHVIAMLTNKILNAKKLNSPEVELWGDGKSLRNFLNVDDLASALYFIIRKDIYNQNIININGEEEVSIIEIAEIIKQTTNFNGKFIFDYNKPNGARKKALNDDYIRDLGWKPSINLANGITNYIAMLDAGYP